MSETAKILIFLKKQQIIVYVFQIFIYIILKMMILNLSPTPRRRLGRRRGGRRWRPSLRLNARKSVLASADPVESRYNPALSVVGP